jgi:hypothetical protein
LADLALAETVLSGVVVGGSSLMLRYLLDGRV